MQERRRRHAAFTVFALTTSLVLPSFAAGTSVAAAQAQPCEQDVSSTHDISRLAGANRWGTAACVAQFVYPDGANVVIVARGDSDGGWADALAGTVLSRHLDAPILLTSPTSLAGETRDEIVRLDPDEIIVLGGQGAVSGSVYNQLRFLAPSIRRIAGTSRAGTASAVASEADASRTAFVVNGYRPADALVAGATAARQGAALLLVNQDTIPADTADAFEDLNITDVVIVGGASVVGAGVHQQLRDQFGNDHVLRVAGPNRAETAASMARTFPSSGRVHLVAGQDTSLVDAIGASWLAARPGGGPVLYTDRDTLGKGANRLLRLGGLRGDDEVLVIGGERVVAPSVVRETESRLVEAAAGGPDAQVRGMWVHLFDKSLKSPEAIDKVLNAAVEANLNTIIVQTARRHDAYYTTDQIPRTADPDIAADFDMLATLIPAAHNRGLQVHAWYSVMPSWHTVYNDLPVSPEQVGVAHGPNSSEPWTTKNNDPNYGYLDPGVPGVQDHVAAMLVDVVERYDIDAVHLDYLRYASNLAGFHDVSVKRFESLGNGNFDDWRRRQTEDLARRIWLEVTAVDPDIIVSMAAIAQGDGPTGPDLMASWRETRAYADKFQDWVGWLDEGIIDAVFPMAYFREVTHATWFDHWADFVATLETDRIVAIGTAAYLNNPAESVSQADHALRTSDGMIVYAYQQDSSNEPNGNYLRHLGRDQFAEPAPPPSTAFKTADPLGHLLIDGLIDGAAVRVASPGQPTRSAIADATGHSGFTGLAPGTWTVTGQARTTTVTIRAARVTRVDL